MTTKDKILALVKEYYKEQFETKQKVFEPGDHIHYGGRFFDEKELLNLVDSGLEFWLTAGRYASQFEKMLAEFLGVRFCSLTNSGSSANLLAFMALTSPKLGDRAIRRGDEVITVAASFPTTITPVIQYGAVPIFVDVTIPGYNIDTTQLEMAYSPKVKAVMVAHTMGNPFDLQEVKDFCNRHNLWLIEDNCDALGSKYFINKEWKYTGTVGDIGTSSFYPPHHITMGEGGAVYTNNPLLKKIVNSFRDWGRDCWCDSGKDDTCGRRFAQQFGTLPSGYDHKYVYAHFGYNLKATDMQAAIGCAQLEKLPYIINVREKNWMYLREQLDKYSSKLILPEPTKNAKPSWFGFLICVKDNAGFTRDDMVAHLEKNNIQTRMLFAGNLIKHPCFDEMRAIGSGYKVVGTLENTDKIISNVFWIGVYAGLTKDMLDFMVAKIGKFCVES